MSNKEYPMTNVAQRRRSVWVAAGILCGVVGAHAYAGMVARDPVFDIGAIIKDPLDAKILKVEHEDNIVVEHVEFTSDHDRAGKPIRTFGIFAYPKNSRSVPGIVWGQSGMADAGAWFPRVFADKGYACISITLPKKTWNAFAPFDTKNPENGNLVRLAVTHMRAITYLCSRQEVDADRIGVGGASYGGVYATLVAGADPRVKAGMSFFAGGNHHLGTNLPQFNRMKTKDGLDIFRRTADGATRFRYRNVPFLWGIASNDHWFHLPAVVATYAGAAGDCRICILPNWAHGFTPEVDQELIDWFDIHLLKTRVPYNKPGELTLTMSKKKLVARWTWIGKNSVKKANIVVSYGRARPWCGWVHRYHHLIPAEIDGNSASAEVPVPDLDLEIYAYGNILDENNVLISTMPVSVIPSKVGIKNRTASRWKINCYPLGALEPVDTDHLKRCALSFGTDDKSVKHSGEQSVRVDPPKKAGNHRVARMKLLNVYERGHKLTVWLKASSTTMINVSVIGVPPQNWNTPATSMIIASMKDMPQWDSAAKTPIYETVQEVGTSWRQVTIECPLGAVPVEGYNLEIQQRADGAATYWIDDIRFEPVW